MEIIDLINRTSVENIRENISICVGNFDGVHTGHLKLISKTIDNPYNYSPAVWTFKVHPNIGNSNSFAIYGLDKKLELLKQAGIKYVLLEDFDNVMSLTKEEFVSLLYKKYNVRYAVCGYNFTFGYNASGKANDFSTLFSKYNVETFIVEPVIKNDSYVSSSYIRNKISNGEIEIANELLGHKYGYSFDVQHGNHLGTQIGYPTINQIIPSYLIKPKFGVYVSKTIIDGSEYNSISNIGVRPTIKEDVKNVICETHIINFDGDLYGKKVDVQLYKFIREEKSFNDLNELKTQIEKDISYAIEYLQ